jgi:hypothetical protein
MLLSSILSYPGIVEGKHSIEGMHSIDGKCTQEKEGMLSREMNHEILKIKNYCDDALWYFGQAVLPKRLGCPLQSIAKLAVEREVHYASKLRVK